MQSQNERISISFDQENSEKKYEVESDDEVFPHQTAPKNQIFQMESQDLSQKVQSNYVKEYLNFFELPSYYKFQLPQITEDISKILVKNGIRFAKEYFHSKPKIKFRKTSPSYSLIELQILLGNFTVLLKILNLQQELPKNANFEQQGGGDAKGSFGEVHFLDWDELINSKNFITIEQLRGHEVSIDVQSYGKQKNQFATKIFYFPDKNSLLQFDAVQFKYDKIFEFMLQYAFCKITSCFKIGLSVDHPFGFDFVCYRNCIQFFMQRGQPISNYLQEDVELVIKELKRKLLLLHSLHIVHRDIKFDNLMYSPTFNTIVFIDFGLSEIVKQCIGQKTKSTYKGSYFFLSQEVKKLMFQEQDFYVDLYWNDAVGLIKTKNMLRKLIQSSFETKYSDTYKIKIDVAEQQLKAKRMINMKNYLKIKIFETISVKNVELSKKVIQNVQKVEKIQLISQFIFFLKGLQSCPRYDEFSLYLLQQLFKCQAYIAEIQQKNQDKYYCLDKSVFLKRYENSSKNIQTHIQVFNEDWKKPLDMLCKQYLLTSKKQIEFSIYTFCCSVMFQNINNTGYIFKKVLKTFTSKILDYFKKSIDPKRKKFVFRSTKQSDSECETCQNQLANKSYEDSQKYIIVEDHLIEINKESAVLMTKYIQDTIFSFFRIENNQQSNSFNIQFLNPFLEKFYLIKKQIDETYLVSKDKISKILIIIFKIYIKESAYNETIRYINQRIKLFCSRQIYMRQLLELINSHLIWLSFEKFQSLINEVEYLLKDLRLKFQFTEPCVEFENEGSSQTNLYSCSENERQQRYAEENLQFQIAMTKIKFQIFHNITQKNAHDMKRRVQNDLKDQLQSLRFKIPNSLFNRKHLDLVNLYIVCNAFMGKELQNLDLIGQYYDLANSLTFQRDVFQGLNTTHTYITSRGDFVVDAKIKSYKKRVMIDASALYIEFEDAEFLERFNFNSFMVDILNNCSNDRIKTQEKLRSSLRSLDEYKNWEGELEDEFLIRKNSVYSNYLSFAFNYKLKNIYEQIKEKIIQNFKAIACIGRSDTEQTKRLKFKSLQNTIVGFIDLRSQEESQSIYQLYELFVDLVEESFELEKHYPEMYFVSKSHLLERLNFNSGRILQLQQLQHVKLSLYYPLHLNYLSFKQCAMFIQSKMSWDSHTNKNMRYILFQVLDAILTEQITDHAIKYEVFSLKVLRFLFYNGNITQAINLLALICKYFYKTKSVKSYMYYRIVKKLVNPKFLTINQTTLQKINIIIPQMIWKSDFSIMYEIAELSIFWGFLMFANQDSIQERLFKKLPLLFNLTSLKSREQVKAFYFQMGAIFFRKIGKKAHFKTFLKDDLRYNPQINKDLYSKSFFTLNELTYLLQYSKDTKSNTAFLNKLVGLHKRIILQKIARQKQKNK